jgi:hypothetical protein
MKRGELAWVDLDKRRPAIIVEVGDTRVIVMHGTGTERPHYDRVCIDSRSPAGRRLGLTKPTYFYARNWASVTKERVAKTAGPCPFVVFHKLEELLADEAKFVAQTLRASGPGSSESGSI